MRLIIVGPTEGVGVTACRLGLLGIGREGPLGGFVVGAELGHLWMSGPLVDEVDVLEPDDIGGDEVVQPTDARRHE
jgi:hypothetical protein